VFGIDESSQLIFLHWVGGKRGVDTYFHDRGALCLEGKNNMIV